MARRPSVQKVEFSATQIKAIWPHNLVCKLYNTPLTEFTALLPFRFFYQVYSVLKGSLILDDLGIFAYDSILFRLVHHYDLK